MAETVVTRRKLINQLSLNHPKMTDNRITKTEPKIIKSPNNNNLQLYARACAPNRDYYGLTITDSTIILNVWKISYGPHNAPKQKLCPLEEFKEDKTCRDEVKSIFGEGVYYYLLGLSNKEHKLENLPASVFIHLLLFVRIEDVLSLMRCSKIMYELCNQDEVWKLMFSKKFGRRPSKEEHLLVLDSSWRQVFMKRLSYVRKALKESQEKKLKRKREILQQTSRHSVTTQ